MTPAPPPVPGGPRGFAPRPVGLDQFSGLAREAAGVLGTAPARLCGLYLLVFLAIQLLPNLPYVAMPLRSTIASVGFAGFFVALESVRQGRPATMLDMALPWRLPAQKLILLVAGGLLPLLFVLLVWWMDLGGAEVDALLGGRAPAGSPTERQQLEFIVVYNLVDMPLVFLQPLCVLFAWSASRTLSANLLAWVANWRWALLLTLVSIPVAIGLDSIDPTSAGEIVLSLMGEVVVEMFLCAFTLVLLQRSLR